MGNGPTHGAAADQSATHKMRNNVDYLLIAERKQISRVDLTTNEKVVLPISGLANVTAIEFDANNNCVMWADQSYNIIGRQCLDGNRTPEVLASVSINAVGSLAFDWMSELLFFIDGNRRTIEVISTAERADAMPRMHRTIIGAREHTDVSGLLVHPGYGYLFWCEYHRNGQHIARANLDGSHYRELVKLSDFDVRHPLALDYEEDRIYWMNIIYNYIARCSIDGRRCVKVIVDQRKFSVYRAMLVHANHIYWYEYRQKAIRRAKKEKRAVGVTLPIEVHEFRAMKMLTIRMQSGANACSCGAHNCSHICVGAPGRAHICLCPDGFSMDEVGQCYCPLGEDEECCTTFHPECAYGQFQCRTHGKCIDE